MTTNKPAHGWHHATGSGQQPHAHFIKPDETAARFRQALPEAEREAANGGYIETLNYAEALVNAASCSTCAFFAGGECRAQPPRLVVVNGLRESAWPVVSRDGWCGSWRQS